jgi:hypothetical protein
VPTSEETNAAGVEARLPVQEDVLEGLQALKPPKKARASFEEFLEIKERRLEVNQQYVDAVAAGDQAGIADSRAENSDLDDQENAAAADAGLFACAERLRPKTERKIREFVEDTWTHGDPAFCTERYTEQYVESFYASLEECEAFESDATEATLAESLDITAVEGVAKARVTVHFTVNGGESDGQSFQEIVVYEDGQYKRQGIFQAS